MAEKIGPKEQQAREDREAAAARELRGASVKERVKDAVDKMKAKGTYKLKTFKFSTRGK